MLLEEKDMLAVCVRSNLGSAGKEIHECLSPFGTIDVMQLLEHNLHLLPIGSTLCDKVKALGQNLAPFYVE